MINRLAKILSIVLHPLIMPVVGLLLLFVTDSPASYMIYELKLRVLLLVLFSTAVIPLSIMPFFLYKRFIKSVEMETTRERLIPFIITCIFYYLAYYLVNNLNLSDLYWTQEKPIIVSFLHSSVIILFIVTLVTIKWKISAHMAGIGGIVGMLGIISFNYGVNVMSYFIIAIALAGVLGSARLKLKAHNPWQVYSGFLLGASTTIIVMNIYCSQ